MTRRHVLAAAILVIAMGVSCSKEQPQQFDDKRLITDAYYEWEKSTHARDIEWWSGFVAPNGELGSGSSKWTKVWVRLDESVEGACGWYIWGGNERTEAANFFTPIHVNDYAGK